MNDLALPEPIEFEWDEWNEKKIFAKHDIKANEAEQVFFNPNLSWLDEKHSSQEKRYNLLGIGDSGRILFITFTIRKNHIRIISARPADKKERVIYAKKEAKENS